MGIVKVNIATAIRQPYERAAKESQDAGRDAVYHETVRIVRDELGVEGTADILQPWTG